MGLQGTPCTQQVQADLAANSHCTDFCMLGMLYDITTWVLSITGFTALFDNLSKIGMIIFCLLCPKTNLH